ncbi:MAG: hypothetical protein JXA13_11315 [Anaerolineales bacterium]|nr:hypothetical protein [Anaerolineales bacterium]
MKIRILRWGICFVVLVLTLACGWAPSFLDQPLAASPAAGAEQPYKITGSFTVSNDFVIATYIVEHAVALVDMHGFVTRDLEWEIPVDSQVLGYMEVDLEASGGSYALSLPLYPEGELNDVDNDKQKDTGLKVFCVAYWPNLVGGPYSDSYDPSRGWPTYLASIKTDTENEDEVIGGSLVVWAPDAEQEFPTGFGADGLLFTVDDPVGVLPMGYSIINLDHEPFTVSQGAAPTLELFEPTDVTVKDFSDLSYSEAFDRMFEIVRKEYAFNGVAEKAPEWDRLYANLKPQVDQAEKENDPLAFYLAVRDFTWAFKDGHVGSSSDIGTEMFREEIGGGYGFVMRELDDGRFLVTYVAAGSPAEQAGMQVGAEVTAWDGRPIGEAVSEVEPWSAPFSTDYSRRYQQVRYLLRTRVGEQAAVAFTNPEEGSITADLVAIAEFDSFNLTSIYLGYDENALPVEFEILEEGIGYVRINSNYDDLNLIIRLFERALKTFEANELEGIIIDMRKNSGGNPLGLAGFLTDEVIEMGQLEYFSDMTGEFEPNGIRETVEPYPDQYQFSKKVLLVDQACASACEIEAYGFSQVPGMIVVGQYPSAGVEAEVARGQFELPDGITLQIPTGRFTLPDGSIFLEGKGVEPDIRVAIDEVFVLSDDDEVLNTAIEVILKPQGEGVEPSGPPALVGPEESENMVANGSLRQLEEAARESYTDQELAEMDRAFVYTIPLNESEPLAWVWGWCAADAETLVQNLEHIHQEYMLAGDEISSDQFVELDYETGGMSCRVQYLVLTDWPVGEHHLSTTITFDQAINDGSKEYQAGEQVYEYVVYINQQE